MALHKTLSLVTVVTFALLVCLAPAVGAAASGGTQIVIYSPFTRFGQLARGVTVTRSASGFCWVGSGATFRSDAWRCMSGNSILDPCYSSPEAKWLACPTGSSWNKVVRLQLTKPLPTGQANKPLNTKKSNPMQVVLTNGVTCGAPTGATGGEVAGIFLSYLCTNGGALYGDPDRSTPFWTILYGPSLTASTLSPASIATARW